MCRTSHVGSFWHMYTILRHTCICSAFDYLLCHLNSRIRLPWNVKVACHVGRCQDCFSLLGRHGEAWRMKTQMDIVQKWFRICTFVNMYFSDVLKKDCTIDDTKNWFTICKIILWENVYLHAYESKTHIKEKQITHDYIFILDVWGKIEALNYSISSYK